MNTTQTNTTVTSAIAFLAGLLAGKGVFGFDAATWATILGAVFGLGTVVWTAYSTKKSTLVTNVATLPEVKTVTLNASAPNAPALADATPSNVKLP